MLEKIFQGCRDLVLEFMFPTLDIPTFLSFFKYFIYLERESKRTYMRVEEGQKGRVSRRLPTECGADTGLDPVTHEIMT